MRPAMTGGTTDASETTHHRVLRGRGSDFVSVLRALCLLGLHQRRGWEFVGSSWQPDLYIRVCIECGQQVYDRDLGTGDTTP